ncbi:DUF4178 domain-containing protein [Nocardiopsis ansamitocini]|uniref:DUF4178 domain-containing protein n=1 Tax=Nocardiopsis ansamitocini TaxID=1670832 RepID=UPI0025575D8C|nr:DUF4178 domain-containing protein [Nocardiopsis ansamitocini]
MVIELVVVALIVGVVVGVVVYLLGRSKKATVPAPATPQPKAPADPFAEVGGTEGDPRSLKAGDMVDFGVERSWIRGSLRLSEGGSVWSEHFLEVEGGRRWLSVEEDPDVQLVMWTGRPDLDLVPGPKRLEVDGVQYGLSERGTASYRSEGTTGLRERGGMDYADYKSRDGHHLSFERFDHGSWEASLGTSVAPGSFTIYPGS